MTLNQRSWYARYYRHFYEKKNMPANLCPFFWATVFAILSTPIVLPTLPWRMKVEGRYPMGIIGWLLIGLFIGYVKAFIHRPMATLTGTLICLGIVGFIIFLIWFVTWIREKSIDARIERERKRERIRLGLDPEPVPGFIGMGVQAAKAWYHRYCPSISWE